MSRFTVFAVFSIAVLATSVFSAPVDDDYNDEIYDPTSRDFTARCVEIAEYAGSNGCNAFFKCCSINNVLNPLNGDRCQVVDTKNGCTLNAQSTGIEWSQCKAHNCTAEITTTTTTTTTTTVRTPASSASGSSMMSFVAAVIGFIAIH